MNPFITQVAPASELRATLFPPTSRYHGIAVQTRGPEESKQVSYLARRLLPLEDRFETILEHAVSEGDRLDNVAAQYLGDPEQFWRIADANSEMNPFELTARIDRRLKITLPEGILTMPQIS